MKTIKWIGLCLLAALSQSVCAQDTEDAFFTARSNGVDSLPLQFIFRSMEPTEVQVDFGDGELKTFAVDSAITYVDGALCGEKVLKVYGDESKLWVMSLYNAALTEIETSVMPVLTCLGLGFNELTDIDLTKYPMLEELTLAVNKLESLDLSSLPKLKHATLFNCGVSEVDFSANPALEIAYVDNLGLTDLDVSMLPALRFLSCSGNALTELDLSKNPNLKQLDCKNNRFSNLDLSAQPDMWYLDVTNNNLILGTLPVLTGSGATYHYAPQNPYDMPSDTVGYVDFSAGYEIDGIVSEYTWRTEDGRTLIRGIDYEAEQGKFWFLEDGLKVMCQMENENFPLFTGEDALVTEFVITRKGSVSNQDLQPVDFRCYTEPGTVCVELERPARVEVFDQLGRLCASMQADGEVRIPVDQAGVYMLRVGEGQGVKVAKLLVL